MKKKAFVDSDIILDLLTLRAVFYTPAADLFTLCYLHEVELSTTAVVFANVFYLLRKKHGIEKAKEQLRKLRRIIKIIPITQEMVDSALNSKFGDFEDGLQYYAAKENAIPVLITRNVKDYKEKDIVVQTAEEFVDGNK
jgi:predicted nucleic acid-binding protein